MRPRIQLALDTTDLAVALDAAVELREYVNIIEAGTHLLLAEGLRVVALLRALFPEKIILADTKIIDSGDVLAAAACAAGADIITVVGAASTSTIEKTAAAARAAGKQVLLDHLADKWDTPEILKKSMLEVDYVGLHLPKDLQSSSSMDASDLSSVLALFTKPVFLAGGIEPALVSTMVGLPVAGFIVGKYLLHGPQRVEKASALKNIVDQWEK